MGSSPSPINIPPGFELEAQTGAVSLPPGFELEPESQAAVNKPGFFKRFGQSLGIPTSREELDEVMRESQPRSVGDVLKKSALGPVAEFAVSHARQAGRGIAEGLTEAAEAGQNIAEGGPIGPNVGKTISGALHGTLQSVPLVGAPIETAGEDIAQGNIRGAAGGLTAVGLMALPFLKGKGKAAKPVEAAPKTETPSPVRLPAGKIEPIATPRGPAINPGVLEKLRADAQNIREQGTISEPLKPEMRVEARTLAEGKAGPSERALDVAREDFIKTAEHLAEVSKQADKQPRYQAALDAAKEQLQIRAEGFLLARRDPAMALRLLQEPLRQKLSPEARLGAVKAIKEKGSTRTEAMIELLDELKPGYSDMFYEAWVNGLLSGPATHAVNMLSNLSHRLLKIPERGIAAGVDFFRSKLTGTPRERFAGEMARDTYGMVAGLQQGIRDGLRAWTTETPIFGKTRIEAARPKAIPGTAGKLVRTPGRALLAADELAKQVNFSASIHAEAYRIAVMEGKSGGLRAARIQELIEKPTEAMTEAARTDAVYRTFQQELGPTGRGVSSLRKAVPGGRFVVPFLRTILNLPKVALEHTPLNFIRIAYKNVIQKHPDFKGGAFSDQMAKPILGTMAGYLFYDLASRGYITGSGPSDPSERRVWREMYQPNAMRVGDQWVQYGRLDPISTHIGMAADLAEARTLMSEGEFEQAVSKMAFSFTQNITSRTWAQGVSDALNAVVDPDRYGKRWIQRITGSFVPTGVANVARTISPEFRRPQSIGEAVKARIPGLSQEVEPLRGIFGETVPQEKRGAIERLVSPFPRTEATDDPATREMVRLKIGMGSPSRKITIGRESRDMTSAEFSRFQQESGRRAKARINLIVKNPNWNKITGEQQEKKIRVVFRDERERARKLIALEILRNRGK